MEKINIDYFKKSLAIYILVAMSILLTLVLISIYVAQMKYKNHEIQSYNNQISSSIEHIREKITATYTSRVASIVKSTNIIDYIQNKDREGLYKVLKGKYELMKSETIDLQNMQVHLSDGTSFLRVHNPEDYGDNIARYRPMLQEVHTKHRMVRGYETGAHGTAYRIIEPLFSEEGVYVGAFEIGINPNFIIEAVEELNGFSGMLFIYDPEINIYSISSDITIGRFKLQSELTPKLKKLYGAYKTRDSLKDDVEIEVDAKQYITHLVDVRDYKGDQSVKLFFFQEVIIDNAFFSYLQYLLYTFMLSAFVLFLFFLSRRIQEHQNRIDTIYAKQLDEINEREKYLHTIFDVTPNIMITTSGDEIDRTNSAMLEFFAYEDSQSFKKEHHCICEFFVPLENHLTAVVQGETWLDYILARPQEMHRVCMVKNEKRHYFTIRAHSLELDEKKRSVVIFNDVTEVQENERIYLDFFEHTNSANIIYETIDNGKTFKVKKLNSKVEQIENVKREDILGRVVNDVFEGIEEFGIIETFQEVYATGKAKKLPVSLYEDNKLTGWRENYIFKLENGDIVASYEDKTEQKKLEQELLSSQHQFELFMQNIPALVFMKDSDGHIVYANDTMNDFFNNVNLIGLTADDLLPEAEATQAKMIDDLVFKYGHIDQVSTFVDHNQEKKAYRYLGFLIEEGDEKKSAMLMMDITKEYEAQKEIIRLKSAFDKSPISIMMTDKDGNIEYVNSNYEKMSGYTQTELLGCNPRLLKSGETDDAQYKKMWDHISHGKVWSSELKNIAKDGSFFWENSTIIPSFNDNSEVDGYIAFKLEISEQMALRAELKNKDEIMIAQSRHAAMGEMISMIAHQWRQPISVISMDANNILVDIALESLDEVSLQKDVEDIVKQTQHLSKTIDDFRDFFKPNKLKNRVLVSDVLLETLSVIGKSLENNNIEVLNRFDTSREVSIFSRELLQVFLNILKNAKEVLIENTQIHRKISNTIYETQESVIVEISDNGGGVKEDVLERIFEPYFTTKDEKNGTGLGLYMSKTIVDKHLKGNLSVRNIQEGVCFRIELPFESGESDD